MTVVLVVLAIITLCIFDVAIILLLWRMMGEMGLSSKKAEVTAKEQKEVDEEALRRAKEKYLKDEKAFREIMNFNAYQAYGMVPPDEEGE